MRSLELLRHSSLIESLALPFPLEFTDQVFTGGLNNNYVYQGENGVFLLRAPRSRGEREDTEQSIRAEYDALGFFDYGDFCLRDPAEQASFAEWAKIRGAKSLVPVAGNDQCQLYPFLSGQPLNLFVADMQSNPSKSTVVENTLHELMKAHANGIVYGDRWVTNTWVDFDNKITELDFDIELIGAHDDIAAFEMAQELYHLIHFADKSRRQMTDQLLKYARNGIFSVYNGPLMSEFLKKHAEYFASSGKPYEHITPPFMEIMALADIIE